MCPRCASGIVVEVLDGSFPILNFGNKAENTLYKIRMSGSIWFVAEGEERAKQEF